MGELSPKPPNEDDIPPRPKDGASYHGLVKSAKISLPSYRGTHGPEASCLIPNSSFLFATSQLGGVMNLSYVLCAVLFLAAMPPVLAAQTLTDPDLKVEQLVSGLNTPTTMAFIGPDDILVLQKNNGRVRRIRGGVLQPDGVLDVAVDSAAAPRPLRDCCAPHIPLPPLCLPLLHREQHGERYGGLSSSLGQPGLSVHLERGETHHPHPYRAPTGNARPSTTMAASSLSVQMEGCMR